MKGANKHNFLLCVLGEEGRNARKEGKQAPLCHERGAHKGS